MKKMKKWFESVKDNTTFQGLLSAVAVVMILAVVCLIGWFNDSRDEPQELHEPIGAVETLEMPTAKVEETGDVEDSANGLLLEAGLIYPCIDGIASAQACEPGTKLQAGASYTLNASITSNLPDETLRSVRCEIALPVFVGKDETFAIQAWADSDGVSPTMVNWNLSAEEDLVLLVLDSFTSTTADVGFVTVEGTGMAMQNVVEQFFHNLDAAEREVFGCEIVAFAKADWEALMKATEQEPVTPEILEATADTVKVEVNLPSWMSMIATGGWGLETWLYAGASEADGCMIVVKLSNGAIGYSLEQAKTDGASEAVRGLGQRTPWQTNPYEVLDPESGKAISIEGLPWVTFVDYEVIPNGATEGKVYTANEDDNENSYALADSQQVVMRNTGKVHLDGWSAFDEAMAAGGGKLVITYMLESADEVIAP